MDTRYIMIIDLHKCVGCGACTLACKTHNEMPIGVFPTGHEITTTGKFPKTKYSYRPTMCNHCTNAACVAVCPTGAMHKDEYGLTVVDPSKCVKCTQCAQACPYGMITPAPDNSAASDATGLSEATIKGCTATGAELKEAVGKAYPCHDPILDDYELPMITPRSPLKCQMCKHLVYSGDNPYCVDACAAGARIFGDVENIYDSTLYDLMQSYKMEVLKPEEGTDPAVYYMREFHKTW
ncbi:MAG: 4Fe-4S dicluster domain-containing protein [Coriobacteriia bacterium]|nr:4Fe-4S dicluster domain-containing protein [Coriobacteriia bacterium]